MENQIMDDVKYKIDTKFVDEFSKEIYEQTYKYGDEDINGTQLRVAKDLASIEKDTEHWTQEFLWALEDFKFVPGGRITSNAGTGLKGTTYINCFVDGFMGEDQDSMEGILDALRRQALILKSEGGYGFCADVMRPRGSFIGGIGNESPGAVRMLDMWDTQSAVITEGSGNKTKKKKAKVKIRKGAQMVTMSVWHPDVEEYIVSKQTPGRLTKFNMSVLITDEFMDAVKNNQPWNLEFPDYEKHSDEYKKEWDGNIKKWKALGYSTVVYKTYENANQLWDMIMTSTYTRNEPGVLFSDTMNKLNNLYYCEYINATNPCGEQILPIGGVCLLGSINLTQFVDFDKKDWDYNKLGKLIPIAVRLMDNVNDKTYVPLPTQKEGLKNKRRIGLGFLGYGSALMMLKVRYGSEEALNLTEKLMTFLANKAYQSSALIASEKGAFPLYDEEKYLNSNFIKESLSQETKDMIRKYGIRNSHLLSIQPTGNSSVFANNVSGGLEPLFMPQYVRTTIMPYAPEGLDRPKNIDWENKTYDSTTTWTWIKEGDENLLSTEFNGYVWKVDKSRGLLRESWVKDYAVRFLETKNEWDSKAPWAATTTELTIDEHVKTMAIMAKYIDSAMSKTVNLPNEYPYEDFKRLYTELYNTGVVKGGTTYRAGTMTVVLSDKSSSDNKSSDENKVPKTTAPKRPKTLSCDIHHLTVSGDKWIVLVGLLGEDPYEIFAFKKKNINLSEKFKHGKLSKIRKGKYDLELDGFTLEDLKELFESDEQEALTRMISTSLRHGADINFIYEQLMKSEGTIVSFSKAIARTLKKYLKDENFSNIACESCGSPDGMTMQEGCYKCKDCGYSKCG
jgi:ribonucleoside-diphosphate reductase alpha chain